MYTIDRLKERNETLREEILKAIENYVASTGCIPHIDIDWVASTSGSAHPLVRVSTVIR